MGLLTSLGSAAQKAGNYLNQNLYTFNPVASGGKVKLPDFQVSENLTKLGNFLNPVKTAAASEPTSYSNGYQSTYDPYKNAVSKQGSVLGTSTGVSSGGNLLSGGQSTGSQDNPFSFQLDAAEQARQAELSAANTELDRNQATLQQQLLQAEQEKGNAITGAENNWNQLLSGVNEKRTESGKLTDEAIGQAGSTARNTQRSNRNVLRSLGILNSTYASDKLQEPTNQFDVERGRLVQGNLDNIKKLDDFELNKKNEHMLAKDQIVQQYGNIVASINNDLRFNDRQRLDAVKQAQAAASQRIADIAASFTNWKNQIDQQKMNFASSIAQYTLANNPSANVSGILSSAMNTANQIYPQSQTVGITQEDIRKRLGQA